MHINIIIPIAILAALFSAAFTTNAESPKRGKQTAQTIELPKNMTPWTFRSEEERTAEEKRRESLTQEERDAEDKKRQLEDYEKLKNPESLSTVETEKLNYWLFLPKNYRPNARKKYPLMLFLHGMGERGSDLTKVKVHGPAKLLDDPARASDWPFITVSPQCPDTNSWSPRQLVLLLDSIEKRYAVDKNRIYVTGLSMGGFGTWALLHYDPDRFAAGVPICGACNPLAAERYVNIPLWIFHGEKDPAVPVKRSIEMADAIKNSGGKKVRLTLYPGVEHDSWTQTYSNPGLYRWLLKQKK